MPNVRTYQQNECVIQYFIRLMHGAQNQKQNESNMLFETDDTRYGDDWSECHRTWTTFLTLLNLPKQQIWMGMTHKNTYTIYAQYAQYGCILRAMMRVADWAIRQEDYNDWLSVVTEAIFLNGGRPMALPANALLHEPIINVLWIMMQYVKSRKFAKRQYFASFLMCL